MRLFTFWITAVLCLNAILATAKPDDDLPPLIITNLKVEPVEGTDKVEFSRFTGSEDEASILYDIHRTNKRVGFLWRYPVYEAKKTREKSAVLRILGDQKPPTSNILVYVHGFSVSPTDAMKSCAEYNKRQDRKYFAIPVIWDTTEGNLFAYGSDRRDHAPDAGESLKGLLELLMKQSAQSDWAHKWSLMCHSMGNYVLRVCAQLRHVDAQGRPEPGKAIFEDIFMVAADVREDIFDTDANDYDPNTYPSLVSTAFKMLTDKRPETLFDIGKMNPCLDIASLANNKVHVLWSRKDKALLGRRTQKAVRGENEDDGEAITTKALGANGNREGKIHELLKNKVVFHDCSSFNSEFPIFHNYQWFDGAIEIYENATGI